MKKLVASLLVVALLTLMVVPVFAVEARYARYCPRCNDVMNYSHDDPLYYIEEQRIDGVLYFREVLVHRTYYKCMACAYMDYESYRVNGPWQESTG